MAMPEVFSLRWNDFHAHLSTSFVDFLEGEDLVDVTLAAGGQYVHAHKLILSVCSPYFKELFKMNPCDHPIVILKDVALQELRQLLQFMYRGEVHVKQQDLSGFLHTAELLQVKALTMGREKSESPPPVSEEDSSTQTHMVEPVSDSLPEEVPSDENAAETLPDEAQDFKKEKRTIRKPLRRLLKNTPNKNSFNSKKKKPWPVMLVNDCPSHTQNAECYATESLPEQVPFFEEAAETLPDATQGFEEDIRKPLKRVLKNPPNKNSYNSKKQKPCPVMLLNDCPSHAEYYATESTPMIGNDNNIPVESGKESGWNCKTGGVKCPSCHRFFANRYNLKVHIRDKHDTVEGTLQCEICQKRMRNPSCLRVHMYHHRKQAAYLAQLSAQGDQMRHVLTAATPGEEGKAIEVKIQEATVPETEAGETI